eukprot:2351000-Lingulodinium_polyedra.AAC.1
MADGTVVEDAARRRNAEGSTCPHCKRAVETQEHRFWQRPCWDGGRTNALANGGPAVARAAVSDGLART